MGMSTDITPVSKASAAPSTSLAWLEWTGVVYVPLIDMPRFFHAGLPGRHLTRAQLELTAGAFTTGVHCAF